MGRAPTRGLSLYPFENTALRIKAQPIVFKKIRGYMGRQTYMDRLRKKWDHQP